MKPGEEYLTQNNGFMLAMNNVRTKDGVTKISGMKYKVYHNAGEKNDVSVQQIVQKIRFFDNHMYEVLNNKDPTRLYFDIDMEGYMDTEGEKFVKMLIREVRNKYPEKNTKVCVMTSHRTGKKSYHITFPEIIFKNSADVKTAVYSLLAEKDYLMSYNAIDKRVYTSNRCMRTLNQSKPTKDGEKGQPFELSADFDALEPVENGDWLIQHKGFLPNTEAICSNMSQKQIIQRQKNMKRKKFLGLDEEGPKTKKARHALLTRNYQIEKDGDFLLPENLKHELKDKSYPMFVAYCKNIAKFIPEDEVARWMTDLLPDNVDYEESLKKHTENLRSKNPVNSWIKGDYALGVLHLVLKLRVIDNRRTPSLFVEEMGYKDDLPLLPRKVEGLEELPVWEEITPLNSDELSSALRKNLKTDAQAPDLHKGLIVSGQMGSGKTKGLVSYVCDTLLYKGKSSVYVSPRVLLAKQFTERLLSEIATKIHSSELKQKVKIHEIKFQISLKYRCAGEDKEEFACDNANVTTINHAIGQEEDEWFLTNGTIDPTIPSISIVVVNSLNGYMSKNPDLELQAVIFDEVAVINGNFGIQDEKKGNETCENFFMQRGIEMVLENSRSYIFVDAGFSSNQVQLCKRQMGFYTGFLNKVKQLELEKALQNKKEKPLCEKKIKRRVYNRSMGDSVLVPSRDINGKPFEVKMLKPIFVCNNPEYDMIFNKIVFVEEKDTFLSMMIDSVKSGNVIAGAYSKAQTMSSDIATITANTTDKFVVPICNQIIESFTSDERSKAMKDQIAMGKRADVFTFTQKLGVGFSLEERDSFDEMYIHIECDKYTPTAPDMVQLAARIRSITSKTIYVCIKTQDPIGMNFHPVLEFKPRPLEEPGRYTAVVKAHVWDDTIKKVMSKVYSAAVTDYTYRFLRGFMSITKSGENGELNCKIPSVEINSEVLSTESKKIMKKNTTQLKEFRRGYNNETMEDFHHSKIRTAWGKKVHTQVCPKCVGDLPTRVSDQLENGTHILQVEKINDRAGTFATWTIKEPTPISFIPTYNMKELKFLKPEEDDQDVEMENEEDKLEAMD